MRQANHRSQQKLGKKKQTLRKWLAKSLKPDRPWQPTQSRRQVKKQLFETHMKTPQQAGESVIKKGSANFQKGLEAVGGRLFLTNQRLVFEAHALNIQRANSEVLLRSIKSVRPSWTRFLRIPLFPNSITIELQEGEILEFVVFGRQDWVSEISRFIQA